MKMPWQKSNKKKVLTDAETNSTKMGAKKVQAKQSTLFKLNNPLATLTQYMDGHLENVSSQDTSKISAQELIEQNVQDLQYLKSITDGAKSKGPRAAQSWSSADWNDRSLIDLGKKVKPPVVQQDREYTEGFASSLNDAVKAYDQYVFEARIQLDKKENKYKFKDATTKSQNEYQLQDYDDFNLNLFKTYCKSVLKEGKMIEEFENNSDFAGVVSMKWISNHIASSTKLKAMNAKLAEKNV